MFSKKLEEFIESDLKRFKPIKSVMPLKDYRVDYSFEFTKKPFYLFGVSDKDKARDSAIALLEFQKANLLFISIIVHENMYDLPKKDQICLMQNSDKQFPTLENFQEAGASTIERLAD